MASLSLQEAAEQAGTSKVDIWRAIQEGALPAQRMEDGGFAIDPAELYRVFERQRPNERPTGQNATATLQALGRSQASATPETASTSDIAVAFAALQVELRDLLGQVAKAATNDKQHEDKDANRPHQLGVIADKMTHPHDEAATGMEEANAVIAETETPIPAPTSENVAETPPKRSWWRRLAGG